MVGGREGATGDNGRPDVFDIDYRQFDSAELQIDMLNATPGTGHDVINITGTATLDGTLHVVMNPVSRPPSVSQSRS